MNSEQNAEELANKSNQSDNSILAIMYIVLYNFDNYNDNQQCQVGAFMDDNSKDVNDPYILPIDLTSPPPHHTLAFLQ